MSLACPSMFADGFPDLCRAVDHYCERTSPAFDAEPVNAVTNGAFLLGAWLCWRLSAAQSNPAAAGMIKALIVAMTTVGLGSFLFHTLGTRWAEWGDVIPILIFMLLYLWFILTRLLCWPGRQSLIVLGVFFFATFYLEAAAPGDFLWGGALFIPTIVSLAAIGLSLRLTGHAARHAMLGAILVFFCTFTARTLDHIICPIFPLGTHFIWHLLNATLLYLFVRLAILYAVPTEMRPAPRGRPANDPTL